MAADKKRHGKGRQHIFPKYKIVIAILLLIALIIIGYATRVRFNWFSPASIVGVGNFSSKQQSGNSAENLAEDTTYSPGNIISPQSFTTKPFSVDEIHKGHLILVNQNYPYFEEDNQNANFTTFENIFSDENSSEGFDLSKRKHKYNARLSLEISPDLISPLDEMMQAYYDSNKDKKPFMIYCTTQVDATTNDLCNDVILERATGYTIDLTFWNEDGDTCTLLSNYDNDWIFKNCDKYGFVLRYTADKQKKTGVSPIDYHFRFVGKLNAAIMTEKGYCLEEYLDFLKNYDYTSPFSYKYNGTQYELYYVRANDEGNTDVPVPADESKNSYYVSGNNIDGFIVSAKVN